MQLQHIITTIATASAIFVNVLGLLPNATEHKLAERSMSLKNRYPENRSVNAVFKDNILLTLAYMDGRVTEAKAIDWYELDSPSKAEFSLKPQETFAFHDDLLSEYKGNVTKTTNSHFNAQEGFRFSGALFGDGVCHLASLIYWAAKDAGLQAQAPTNHDFRNIPEVPREYGVSIFSMPGKLGLNARQNLYITNTLSEAITFRFTYDGENLTVAVVPKETL